MRLKTTGELNAEKVQESLKEIRWKEDLGARTYDHYLQAMDEFGKWLVASKRQCMNPVLSIERLNAETDVRHKRRALSPDEVSRLVERPGRAARSSRAIPGNCGRVPT